jgi:hypothetical protein
VYKLLTTMLVFLVVALLVLGLRQHRLELTSQTAWLQGQIAQREQTLWGQRMAIARATNPTVLASELQKQNLAGDVGGTLPWDGSNSKIGKKIFPTQAADSNGDLIGNLAPQ